MKLLCRSGMLERPGDLLFQASYSQESIEKEVDNGYAYLSRSGPWLCERIWIHAADTLHVQKFIDYNL